MLVPAALAIMVSCRRRRKKGDKAAWGPRLARSMDVLVQNVTNGLNAMPPRGLCMDCTAEDYQAAIQWMTE